MGGLPEYKREAGGTVLTTSEVLSPLMAEGPTRELRTSDVVRMGWNLRTHIEVPVCPGQRAGQGTKPYYMTFTKILKF